MALFEETLSLGTLYKVGPIGPQGQTRLFVNSGTVNVYGSDSLTQPTAISEMTLNAENENVSGVLSFGVIPKWLAITQNSGTTTELVSYGVAVVGLGAIS